MLAKGTLADLVADLLRFVMVPLVSDYKLNLSGLVARLVCCRLGWCGVLLRLPACWLVWQVIVHVLHSCCALFTRGLRLAA
jgi:hypothetical protein